MKTLYFPDDADSHLKGFNTPVGVVLYELIEKANNEPGIFLTFDVRERLARNLETQLMEFRLKQHEGAEQQKQAYLNQLALFIKDKQNETIRANESLKSEAEPLDPNVRATKDGQDAIRGHCGQDTGT